MAELSFAGWKCHHLLKNVGVDVSLIEKILFVVKKFCVIIFLCINYPLFKNGTKLYGVPRIIYSKRLVIGKNVRINEEVFIHAAGGVSVGDNVTLSYGVSVISTGYETSNWDSGKFLKAHREEKIIIGNNVWLGANTTVLQGVTIEEGIVVAAGSVVTSSLREPASLYAGVPARFVKRMS